MEKKVQFRDRPNSFTSLKRQKSFTELIICALCGFKLNVPKMLSCQHTFCLACLQMDASNRQKNPSTDTFDYDCPTCATTSEIKSFKDLSSNIHVDSLLALLGPKTDRPLSMTPSEGSAHNTIITTLASDRCSKCEVVLVTDDTHKTDSGSSSATTSTAVIGSSGGGGTGNGAKSAEKMFKCRHCKFYFCPVCWTVHMEQLRNQLQGLDAQLNLVRQRLLKKSEQFETRLVDVEESISAFISGKIEKLKLRESKLLSDVKKLAVPERDHLKEIKTKIKNLSKSLQEASSDQSVPLDQVFLDRHGELSRLINTVSTWGEKKFKFDTTLGSIETAESSDHSRKLSESEDNPDYDLKRRVFKVKLLWNRCPHPMGVAEAPWKDELVDEQLIYIAAADSKVVIGIDRKKGRVVRKIQQSAMEYPHSICFSADREEIAVSDKWANYIFIFNRDNVLLRVIGDKGEDIGFLRSPEGVAIDGDILYVCDTGNDRVQGFDIKTGDVLFQFGNLKPEQVYGGGEGRSKRVDLNAPTSIAIHQDKIIILDSAECRVKVYNKANLNQISEFGKMGQERGEFNNPENLAVDPNGMIYVGDSGNARIQVFDRKLEFLRSIGTRGTGSGQFNWISALCLTEAGELVVSDFKNHTVQVLL